MKRYSIRPEKMPAMSGRSARSAMANSARAKANAIKANAINASKKNSSNKSVRRTPYPNVHDLNLPTYLRSNKGKTMKNRFVSMLTNPFRRSKVSN